MQQQNDTQQNNIIFPVSELYIQLDTNTGPDGESNVKLFKRSMIKMPKMDTPPILTNDFPYFTKNVRYPESIQNETWRKKYEFFFNRDLFVDRLRSHIDSSPSSYKDIFKDKQNLEKDKKKKELANLNEWVKETEIRNIMITLRALFPIPEVFGKSLKNSYEHVLMQENNSRVFFDVNIRDAFNIFGFMYKFGIVNKEKEEYFINIDGKRYAVDDVLWENDVVNHPIYNTFLMAQRETYEEVTKSRNEIDDKYEKYAEEFTSDLCEEDSTGKLVLVKEIEILLRNVEDKSSTIDKRSVGASERLKITREIINKLDYIDLKFD